MSNEEFFSKANLYPTIWAIVVGLLAFAGGLIWRNWSGPDEVVVLNKYNNSKDTTITIIQFQPDERYFEELNKLTSKKTTKRQVGTDKPKAKREVDSISMAIAKKYQSKFDSLRVILRTTEKGKVNNNLESVPTNKSNPNSIQVKRPKFKLPSIVEGYTDGKINSYASFGINTYEFEKNETVNVSIDFFSQSTLNKMTTLFVDIVEPKNENSVYQIWSEQYQIKDLKNVLTFAADFKPGKYQLTIGFYFTDEIERKYPTFYSKRFSIVIK